MPKYPHVSLSVEDHLLIDKGRDLFYKQNQVRLSKRGFIRLAVEKEIERLEAQSAPTHRRW